MRKGGYTQREQYLRYLAHHRQLLAENALALANEIEQLLAGSGNMHFRNAYRTTAEYARYIAEKLSADLSEQEVLDYYHELRGAQEWVDVIREMEQRERAVAQRTNRTFAEKFNDAVAEMAIGILQSIGNADELPSALWHAITHPVGTATILLDQIAHAYVEDPENFAIRAALLLTPGFIGRAKTLNEAKAALGLSIIDKFCFAPDTLVAMPKGQKPIGEIEPGEKVVAFDFVRGEWVESEVLRRHDHVYSGVWVTIGFDGWNIQATARHPFWVLEGAALEVRAYSEHLSPREDQGKSIPGRWVDSHELRVGDVVVCRDGSARAIERIETKEVENQRVCNLTIREQHTFAVGADGVLVHNTGWCNILDKIPGLKTIRQNLATKLGVPIRKIHGHHIVQKKIPDQYSTKARGRR